jgi:hypothetical protein
MEIMACAEPEMVDRAVITRLSHWLKGPFLLTGAFVQLLFLQQTKQRAMFEAIGTWLVINMTSNMERFSEALVGGDGTKGRTRGSA